MMEYAKNGQTQFIKKVLVEYEDSQRCTGRTTNIVLRALAEDATIVYHTLPALLHLQRLYNVKVISLSNYLNPDYHRGRGKVKYIFDHFAEYKLLQDKLDEVESIVNGNTLTR